VQESHRGEREAGVVEQREMQREGDDVRVRDGHQVDALEPAHVAVPVEPSPIDPVRRQPEGQRRQGGVDGDRLAAVTAMKRRASRHRGRAPSCCDRSRVQFVPGAVGIVGASVGAAVQSLSAMAWYLTALALAPSVLGRRRDARTGELCQLAQQRPHAGDLVRGEDVFVAATGVTSGALLRGVRFTPELAITESIVLRSRSGTMRRVEAEHSLAKSHLIPAAQR